MPHIITSKEDTINTKILTVTLDSVYICPQAITYEFDVMFTKSNNQETVRTRKSYDCISGFLQLLRLEATLQQVVIPDDPYRPAIEELHEYHQKLAGQFIGKKKQRTVTAEFSRMHCEEQSKANLSINYILHRLMNNNEIRDSVAMKAFFLDYDFEIKEFEHWNLNVSVSGPRISSSFSAKIDEVIFDIDDLWYKIAVTEQGETVHHIYRQYFELEFLHDQLIDESQERGQLPKSFPQELLHLRNELVNNSKAQIIKENKPVWNIYAWLRQNSATRSQFRKIEQELDAHIQELNGFIYLLTFPLTKSETEFHFFDVINIDKTEVESINTSQEDNINISVKFCTETNKYCITAGDEPKITYHSYEDLKKLDKTIHSKWFYKGCDFPNWPENDADDIANYLRALFSDCILTWDDHLRFALGLSEKEPADIPPEPKNENLDERNLVKEVNIDENFSEKYDENLDGLEIIIQANVSHPRLRNGKLYTTIDVAVGSNEPYTIHRHHGEFEQLHSYLKQTLKYQVEGFYIPDLPNLDDLYELMEALYQISNYYGGVDTLARRREEQDLQVSVEEKLIEAADGYNQFLSFILSDYILSDDGDVWDFVGLTFEDLYAEKEIIRRFENVVIRNLKRTEAQVQLKQGTRTNQH